MIPKLSVRSEQAPATEQFLAALSASTYSGEIRDDFSSRLVTATDNSIYQVLPEAVLFPRSTRDLAQIFSLAQEPAYRTLTFSPRGGGTGTNGQSLSPGIVIDCSKFMREIIEINPEERWVTIQPGVVLDQLNKVLKPHGLFFAPNLSPSNRATLGGMINTDACGKGSRIYGRTSSHVLELTTVLTDGTVHHCKPLDQEGLDQTKQSDDRVGLIHRLVDQIVTDKAELINHVFPKMDRFLTGYNLAHVYDDQQQFHLDQLICGSEGSLAVVSEAKLNLVPLPKCKGLVAVKYPGFNEALADAMDLLSTEPAAIETIDEKILELARGDAIWHHINGLLGDDANVRTVNLVEYIGQDEEEVQQKMRRLDPEGQGRLGCYLTTDAREMNVLWDLRKKGVGLLGNMPGTRKPIAFVEDTAVPPHNLADYIRDFRKLLNDHQIPFAMYGHVDVGCLHVRPALDMQDPMDEALVRKLSDAVVALVRKYGGVMWAEHGKGFRSEYTDQFFGEELFADLRRIKAAFDPENRLNPGKVVLPEGIDEGLVAVEAPLKGQFDRQVAAGEQQVFQPAMACNGNGACFNVEPTSVMCPSSKITRDRIHSPKGRAALIREWLRQLSYAARNPNQPIPFQGQGDDQQDTLPKNFDRSASWLGKQFNRGGDDFSHEVKAAMSGCLSCKACATQCPIHVDIPDFKARFLQRYHTRYPRPLRDFLVGNLEGNLPLMARFAGLTNLGVRLTAPLVEAVAKLVDSPKLSTPSLSAQMKKRGLKPCTAESLAALTPEDKAKSVILMPDSFTAFYDGQVFWTAFDLLHKLGFNVHVPKWQANGKPLHIKGFLDKFKRTAQRNAQYHQALAQTGVPLVCLEPSIALTYRDEYPTYIDTPIPKVQLLQEWLADQRDWLQTESQDPTPYYLLAHCMEQTGAPGSSQMWVDIFSALGKTLEIVPVGCCGMAGTYGHEAEHQQESRGIWDLSWAPWFDDASRRNRLLATGYSCRTQAKRFADHKPKHPVEVLL